VKRIALLPVVIVVVVIVVGLTVAAISRLSPSDRVYSVTEVQVGLRQQPRAWAGRVVRIYGAVDLWWGHGCPSAQPGPCHYTAGVYLRPATVPKWSDRRAGAVLSATFAVVDQPGAPSIALRMPGTHPDLLIVYSAWGKTSALMPASLQEPSPRMQPLPFSAYLTPLVGPILARLFPPHMATGVIVRVRVNDPRSCPARHSATIRLTHTCSP